MWGIIALKMPQHLTTELRHTIIHLHRNGYSQRMIASEVGCSKTGVNTTIKRWLETHKLTERKGRECKLASTQRQDISCQPPTDKCRSVQRDAG